MAGTILFGDDGSQAADLAWMWINAQSWGDWGIDVLTAHHDGRGHGSSAPRPWTPDRPRTLINPAAAASVRHLEADGDPRAALLEGTRGHDLLVVGPRGTGLMKALHLGSTAEWLLHRPPAPLVIARQGRPVQRAVVCTDGSRDATAAARVFAKVPWISEVDVHVISVEQQGIDPESVAGRTAELYQGAAKSVRPLAIGPDRTEVFYHVRDLILDYVQQSQADLIVQGTTGQSAWASLRAGSIATSLATHAPCSVLIAHDTAKAS
jgi:nucleotide-binding universal stress UspA family protein